MIVVPFGMPLEAASLAIACRVTGRFDPLKTASGFGSTFSLSGCAFGWVMLVVAGWTWWSCFAGRWGGMRGRRCWMAERLFGGCCLVWCWGLVAVDGPGWECVWFSGFG